MSRDESAPKAAIHSLSSTGSPPCTGVLLKVVPLSVEVATDTDPRFRLDTYMV